MKYVLYHDRITLDRYWLTAIPDDAEPDEHDPEHNDAHTVAQWEEQDESETTGYECIDTDPLSAPYQYFMHNMVPEGVPLLVFPVTFPSAPYRTPAIGYLARIDGHPYPYTIGVWWPALGEDHSRLWFSDGEADAALESLTYQLERIRERG